MRAEFDETLVTGNEMIDGQHKELIERINQLLESCEDGQGKVKAKMCIRDRIKPLSYPPDFYSDKSRDYSLRGSMILTASATRPYCP